MHAGHALGTLRFFREILDDRDVRAAFDRKVIRMLRIPFGRVGWDPADGEPEEVPALRRALIEALGRAGDPEVIAEARKRFAARGQKPLDALMRPTVLNIVGRHADAATFDALLADWRRETWTVVRYQYQAALRQAADPALARRWMEIALRTREMPPGEAVFNVRRTGADSGQRQLGWDFVRENLAALYARSSPRGRVYVLADAASAFTDEAIAEELLSLTREKLGPGVAPREIDFVATLPKTRSGKIMRRLLKARELGLPEGDISTLEDD